MEIFPEGIALLYTLAVNGTIGGSGTALIVITDDEGVTIMYCCVLHTKYIHICFKS
jgi:hypothetical protein